MLTKSANEIDHIATSASDLSNLQLLCRECHLAKTRQSLVPAQSEVPATVHRPIRQRAMEMPNRQPCDATDWQYHLWTSATKTVPDALMAAWKSWAEDPTLDRIDPQIAVAGFPLDLDPWAWYLETPPEGTAEASRHVVQDDRAHYAQLQEASRLLEENRQWWKDHEARLEVLRNRPIATSVTFRPPVSGKGTWHVSNAEIPKPRSLKEAADLHMVPACGSRSVTLDPDGASITLAVGDVIPQHATLCSNCMRMAQKTRA